MMRVRVDIDDNVIAELSIAQNPDADTNARTLAPMLAHAGTEAVWKMHGDKVATTFGHYMFAMAPPTEACLQYERLYGLLGDLVNGKANPRAWRWHNRRLDNAVVLTKIDGDCATPDTIVAASHVEAFVDLVRANYHLGEDNLRVLGGLFASYGIAYNQTDASAEPIDGHLPGLPGGAAAGQRAVIVAAKALMVPPDRLRATVCEDALAAQAAAHPVTDGPDTAPDKAKNLASYLSLHPLRARRLIADLRAATPDKIALLADALEADANRTFHVRDTISLVPPRPPMKATPADAEDDATEATVRSDYKNSLAVWRRLYGKVGPKRSNNLVRRAIGAMRFDWNAYDNSKTDSSSEAFEKRFGFDQTEEIFRKAVRPWVGKKKFVEVGNVRFGKLGKRWSPKHKPLRKSDTPRDFYRLLYLLKPTKLDFDDMHGQGLFGIVSPCGRFAMSFYFHKYELAAYQFVKKEMAVRTREERGPFIIRSGIPGSDNGVGVGDKDARRWFKMVAIALGREWTVYGGNNFNV